jgi:CRISPR-associated protein Cst2
MRGIEIVWLSKTDLTNLNSGEGESNLVDVKKFKKNGIEYPYVSGQAMRYYIKEAIRRNLSENEFMCVPDDRGEPCGEPEKCIGCDLFGFMKAVKDKGAETRVSPVKVSPAIGLLPFEDNSTLDFLTRRHKGTEKAEGDIVNVELGVNIYKAGIAIDVRRVGGEEKIEGRQVKIEYFIDDNERKKRIAKLLNAIRFLTDYSKQARLLTDFTPDFIIIALQDIYSHRLQKAIEFKDGKLDIERLSAIIREVKQYSPAIFVGLLPGTLKNEKEVLKAFNALDLKVKTPDAAINDAIDYLNKSKL